MELNTGDMSLYDSIDPFAVMDIEEDVDTNIKISDSNRNKSISENMAVDSEIDVNMRKSEPCNNDMDDVDVNMKVYDDTLTKDLGNDSNSSINNKITNKIDLERVPEIKLKTRQNEEGSNKNQSKETGDLEENVITNEDNDGTKSHKDEDTGQLPECDESSRESNSSQQNDPATSKLEEIPSSYTNGDLDYKSKDFDDSIQKPITQEMHKIFNRITEIDNVVRQSDEEIVKSNVNECEVCQKCEEGKKKDLGIGEKIVAKDKEIGLKCKCKENKDTERQNAKLNEPDKSEKDETNCSQERAEINDIRTAENSEISKTKMKVLTTDDETKNTDCEQKNADKEIKTDLKDDTSNYDMKRKDKESKKEDDESSKENDKSIKEDSKSCDESRKEDDKSIKEDSKSCNASSKGDDKSSKEDDKSSKEDDESSKEDDDVVELPQPPQKCISVDSEDSQGPTESRTADPVFVEIGVETILAPSPPDSPNDCMMIIENVQVDIDPSSLIMNDDYEEEEESDDDDGAVEIVQKKPDEPVSLLTSSDEDDVILQEPHIDTVDVSDETDEDDVPLTRLVRAQTPKKADKKLSDIFWGKSNEVYCYLCKFVTKQRAALALHMSEEHAGKSNEKLIEVQVCPQCRFHSASRSQFVRHMRKHKTEKTFRCALCDYRAKHKYSLVYHMKSHRELATYKCKKCPFRATAKSLIQKHLKVHASGGMLHCAHCDFKHRSPGMLKLHVRRKHKSKTAKTKKSAKPTRKRPRDDDEYVPGMEM